MPQPLAADPVRQADCLIVANPAAAGVSPAAVSQVEQRLAPLVRSVQTEWTRGPGSAAELIADAELVVALGGDGTVADLLPALSPTQVLCVLPAGSGNSTARNLYGDLELSQVLDLVTTPGALGVQRLDLLHLVEPDALAFLGASSGFLAEVLVRARAAVDDRAGIDRYFAAAVDVLKDMPDHPTSVSVDGILLSDGPTSSVAVGGGRFRARAFQFLPESVLDDGLLDVSTIGALGQQAVAELVPLMPSGAHLGHPDVHYARGRRVVVERTDGRPLVAEWDGTVWDAAGSRLTVGVVPAALSVLTRSEGEHS